MFTPFILFLGLTVATAVIAYWSDNLGKKLGKKRVTLMGLRPRTTATILTISSSWAIMLFTLAVLLAVVTPLRNALFRYDSERTKYLSDISTAEARLSTTRGRLLQSQSRLAQSQSSLKKADANIEKAQQDTKKALSDAKAAQNGVKRAQDREKQAQDRAEAAQDRAKAARQREVSAQQGEVRAEQLKERATRDLNSSRVALRGIREELVNTQNQLTQKQTEILSVQTNLRTAEASYKQANAAFLRTGRAAKNFGAEVLSLSRQTLSLQRQRDLLQAQVTDLEKTAQIYSQAAVQLAGGDVRIPVGKTFAARIIGARESPTAIEAELRQILAQGEEIFAQSPETETLYDQGARLILFPRPERGTDNTPILRDLAQVIALNSAATSGTATSVRLVAAFNFTAEEKQIAVRFVAVPVAVAFAPGEVLASATIAASGGDALIFRALNDLIEAGRQRAVQRNVNPPLPLNEPYFYAEGTNVALFDALRRIEKSGQPQRVRLITADALSTVEPLRVRFEVENVS